LVLLKDLELSKNNKNCINFSKFIQNYYYFIYNYGMFNKYYTKCIYKINFNIGFINNFKTIETKNLFLKLYLKWCIRCQIRKPYKLIRTLNRLNILNILNRLNIIKIDFIDLIQLISNFNMNKKDALYTYSCFLYYIINNLEINTYEHSLYLIYLLHCSKIMNKFILFRFIKQNNELNYPGGYVLNVRILSYMPDDLYVHNILYGILNTKDRIRLYYEQAIVFNYNYINRLYWFIGVYRGILKRNFFI